MIKKKSKLNKHLLLLNKEKIYSDDNRSRTTIDYIMNCVIEFYVLWDFAAAAAATVA